MCQRSWRHSKPWKLQQNQMNSWLLTYDVTADFMPYRHWTVRAEGEASARLHVSRETGIPVEELAAAVKEEVTA